MNTALRFQPAKGVATTDFDGGRLDPGLFARALLDPFDLVTMSFRPAGVHSHEHVGPILRFGPTRTRMHFKERVVAVGLARQQALEAKSIRFSGQFLDRPLGLGNDIVIVFGFTKFDQFDVVFQLAFEGKVTRNG